MPSIGMSYDYTFRPSPLIFAAEFEDMAYGVESLKEPLTQAVRKVVIPSIRTNFDVGGRPGWAPLSDATEQIKFAGGYSGGILIRTGSLRRTMGYPSIWTITDQEAYIADLPDKVAYGKVHQSGSSMGSGRGSNIPPRIFAMIQPEDEEKIVQIFDTWLGTKEAEAGW
jgi:phage gpG-like protein